MEGTRKQVACPSCGAPVRFRGASSVVAVCPYCKSTLVREGADIENIGKQAELLEDHSPIRLGTEGFHRGDGFTVVGRIQFRYEAGLWNEWYVLMRGGKGAWLSDASREYTLTYLIPPQQVPPFESLKPQSQVTLAGDKWYAGPYSVTNLDQGEVVAGEGELPFRFSGGWKANVADLRDEGARFATIDYSLTPPHIYVGEKLPFDTFRFSGLRDPEQVGFTKGTSLSFKCTGCGAPIEKRLTTTEVVACGYCGSVTDVSGNTAQAVQKNELNLEKFKPMIPLGASGAIRNVRYEVVGFMRRGITVDGILYEWSEWLLHNVEHGYAWVTEYDGHFNLAKAAAQVPKPVGYGSGARMKYLGHDFRHFQHANAKVTYLAGEFYWRVKLGEEAVCDDYVDPPLILSGEKSAKEINWTLGEYIEGRELFKAFNLKTDPPRTRGVAPNQPSPYKGKVGRYWLAFLAFVVLGLLGQAIFSAAVAPRRAPEVIFLVDSTEPGRTTSPPFRLGGWPSAPVTVRTNTNTTDWLQVGLQLTNVDTGQAYTTRRNIGYQRIGNLGHMEGSAHDVAEIRGVPSGNYTLAVDTKASKPVRGTVEVYRSSIGWSNFWLFAGFLFLWPLVATAKAFSFEQKRWSESDYGSSSGSGGDDED